MRREDEIALRVEDMPLDGLVIMEVPCRSPALKVGVADVCQQVKNIDKER